MFLPLLLLVLSLLGAGLVAYGAHPVWAQYSHGLQFILLSWQFQWPLAIFSILLCLALAGLVVAGRRSAWWLIGLGPVLAILVHRLHNDPARRFAILDNPDFVSAEQALFVGETDYVVGLTFNGTPYAYPYTSLYQAPVIFQADRDKRMVLLWSAFANRALACGINRQLHARDVEIVSMPANALLIHNWKLGEFINGITGRTPKGNAPTGIDLDRRIPVHKLTWRESRTAHPDTKVLTAIANPESKIPARPLLPYYPLPRLPKNSPPPLTRIVMVAATQPVALVSEQVDRRPLNLAPGGLPILVLRDPSTQRIRAYFRRIDDLMPRFDLNTSSRRQGYLIDKDSNSGWSIDGKAVDGRMAEEGRRLEPAPLDDGLYYGVMKTWLPTLQLIDPATVK